MILFSYFDFFENKKSLFFGAFFLILCMPGAIAAEKNKSSRLLRALRAGHPTIAKRLITQGSSINAPDEQGNTPLSVAVEKGYPSVVKSLLEKKADVNGMGGNKTPLFLIASKSVLTNDDNSSMLQLLAAGADPIAALQIARAEQSTSAIALLADMINDALATNVKNGNVQNARYFLQTGGADVNYNGNYDGKNRDKETLTMMAVDRGDIDMVALLLEFGSAINMRDALSQTALSHATFNLSDARNRGMKKRQEVMSQIIQLLKSEGAI